MFRLISTNTQNGLKGAVLLKAKHSKTIFSQIPPGMYLQPSFQIPCSLVSYPISLPTIQFLRFNSMYSSSQERSNRAPRNRDRDYHHETDRQFNDNSRPNRRPRHDTRSGYQGNRQKPRRYPWLEPEDFADKMSYIKKIRALRATKDRSADQITELQTHIERLPKWAIASDYEEYLSFLIHMSYDVVTKFATIPNPSSEDRNRRMQIELATKEAILSFSEIIKQGKIDHLLSEKLVTYALKGFHRYRLHREIVDMWERGIADELLQHLYMSPWNFARVIPAASIMKRFTYEEIVQIYEKLTDDTPLIPVLAGPMGALAVQNGDYTRAMDILEKLLDYEGRSDQDNKVAFRASAEIHNALVGECTDLATATSFFEKAVYESKSLPYDVQLRTLNINQFFSRCLEEGVPFDDIITYYNDTYRSVVSKSLAPSSYEGLNWHFFSLFFKNFPEPTEQARDKLWGILKNHPEISPKILHIVISKCAWENSKFLQELFDSLEYFGFKKDLFLCKSILRGHSKIQCSNEQILKLWNELLCKLDENKEICIPNTYWFSFRDAALASEYSAERYKLFLEVTKTYKDYMLDNESCRKFMEDMSKGYPSVYDELCRIATEEDADFGYDNGKIEVPEFKNLKPNVNFKEEILDTLEECPPGSIVDENPIIPGYVAPPGAITWFEGSVQKIAKELDFISEELEGLSITILGNGTQKSLDKIAQEVEAVVTEVETISKEIRAALGRENTGSNNRDVNDIARDVESICEEVEAISLEIGEIMKK
ncbi:RMD9 [[Candida] subhashii]|uniref:RMD9 n=1 Tax=[Candida] subhashii TaxID=561895 RepID=A0A8J5QHB9_9ASCO|nr:RMD9 [[Candida] subhashii]KAG7665729.1 RMD9 [[Candida] subhashii]